MTLLRFLSFWLFPTWTQRREMRRALWTAFLATATDQRLRGQPIQFSAQDFDVLLWLWSERRRLERERDRFVHLLDGVNQRNAELKAALNREVKRP